MAPSKTMLRMHCATALLLLGCAVPPPADAVAPVQSQSPPTPEHTPTQPPVKPMVQGRIINPTTDTPLSAVRVGFVCPDTWLEVDCTVPPAFTDPDGRFELEAPPAGEYELYVSGDHLPGLRSDGAWWTLARHTVSVQGTTDLGRLHARAPQAAPPFPDGKMHTADRRMLVDVVGDHAYVGKFSGTAPALRAGDEIVSVDGYLVEDIGARAIRSMFLDDFPLRGETHTVTVQRGTRSLEVVLVVED